MNSKLQYLYRLHVFRIMLLVLTLGTLSACALLSNKQQNPITIFSPEMRIIPDASWPKVSWQLSIAKPVASRMLDSPRIVVQPTPGELQYYKGASWAQATNDLIETSVLRGLEDSGKIAAVARAGSGIRDDYRLLMELRRFDADYAGQVAPRATIEITTKLLNISDQRVVASRTFASQHQATQTDIAAVAAAFEVALNQISTEIAGWTLITGADDSRVKR